MNLKKRGNDGGIMENVIIRKASRDDAGAMIIYMKTLLSEETIQRFDTANFK
jgi:hypothetical protein